MTREFEDLDKRAVAVAKYMISRRATMREAADEFGLDKRLVWMDINQRLPEVDEGLYRIVRKLIDHNKKMAGRRGGLKAQEERRKGFNEEIK